MPNSVPATPKGLPDRDTLVAMFGDSPDAILVEHFDVPTPVAQAPNLPRHIGIADKVYANPAFMALLKERGLPTPQGSSGEHFLSALVGSFDQAFRDRWHSRPYHRIDNMQLGAHFNVGAADLPPLMMSTTPIVIGDYIYGCWTRITDASEAVARDVNERRALKQIDAFVRTENVPLMCLEFKEPLPASIPFGELAKAYYYATIAHITDSAAALFKTTPSLILQRQVAELQNSQVQALLSNAFPVDEHAQQIDLGDTAELQVEIPGDAPLVYRVKPTFVFESGNAGAVWLRIEDVTQTELQQRKQKTLEQTRELAMAAASLYQFESSNESGQFRLDADDLSKLNLAPLPNNIADWQALLSSDRLSISQQEIEDIFAGRTKDLHFIARLPNLDGEDSYIEVWGLINPTVGPNRQGHTIGLLRDVTHTERLNARLREKKTLEGLGVLAGGVAHDFNNLLMSVLGYAELMEADLLDASGRDSAQLQQSALQNITEIRTAALRASELCTSLLAYAGQHLIEKKNLDLTELLRSTSELVEVTIGKRVPLLLELENEVLISADKGQLTQVIINLVGNAADAMEGYSGGIQLSVDTIVFSPEEQQLLTDQVDDPTQRFACLRVADSGCGMSKETQERIYEPFFTTKAEGRGLGMAAVHGIVKHHGGVILLRSGEGEGTEFRVCLPLLARIPTGEHQALEPPKAATISRPKVLVVDDEAGVRTIAAEMLRHLNCDVMEAESAEAALALFAKNRFDYALLDITMPVMSGTELAEVLLERVPDLTVVLCSGYTEKDVPDALLARCDFIHKPYTLKEVSDTLKLERVMGEQAVPV